MNPSSLYEYTAGRRSLGFDDVHILASRPQGVLSRDCIDFDRSRLVVAPMSALQDEEFVRACAQARISQVIHRFNTPEEQARLLLAAKNASGRYHTNTLWIAVGLKDWKERIETCGKSVTRFGIVLDVANGFSYEVEKVVKQLKAEGFIVMAGNVHTAAGAAFLQAAGATYIRVGIANGMACATRDRTGVTRGQISSVLAAVTTCPDAIVVSDGGIKCPADVAKAMGAGAIEVMMGGMFIKAKEAKTQKTGSYYGGASKKQKELLGIEEVRYVEGKEIHCFSDEGLTVESIVQSIEEGVRSAVSYSGYIDLDGYIGNADFEIV